MESEESSQGQYVFKQDEIETSELKYDKKKETKLEQEDASLMEYHRFSIGTVLRTTSTKPETGLSSAEAAQRLLKNGLNVLTPHRKNIFLQILGYLFRGFGLLFWICSFLSFISWEPLGEPNPNPFNLALGIMLIIVILIQAAFNAWQEFKSDKLMATLRKMILQDVKVKRDGKIISLKSSQLVVGDFVNLEIGNKIPADIRLTEVNGLKMNEAILTGESEAVPGSVDKSDEKNYLEATNMAFMGTNVEEGSAWGVVVATGDKTAMGKIAKLASTAGHVPQLLLEIRRFVIIIATLSITTALISFFSWLGWLNVDYSGYMNLPSAIANCIGIIVAFVPNGLPICVTLTLTVISKQMAKNYVLVKHLPAVETLGSVNVILSDKTGTLTENKLTVNEIYMDEKLYKAEHLKENSSSFTDIINICCLCNHATIDAEGNVVGDGVDTALLKFSAQFIKDLDQFRIDNKLIFEIPFNSKNKFMLSVYEQPDNPDFLVLMKGAAEIIVSKCNSFLSGNTEQEFTEDKKQLAIDQIEKLAATGQKVIGFCRLYVDPDDNIPNEGFCFVGLVAMIDPPRTNVKQAIEECKGAGVKVLMVTGDHPAAAVAISKMIGLITHQETTMESYGLKDVIVDQQELQETRYDVHLESKQYEALVVKGSEISNFTTEMWDWVIQKKEVVFARTLPEHKMQIVKEYQSRKYTVAVTGDGVNDAPALRQADIGVAMMAGADVSKESADLILVNNNFTSVVAGIRFGRVVFENLKKVIRYLLPAGSWSELLPALANFFIGLPLPLSPFLMIYINVVTDVLPALSLVYERPEGNLMKLPPRNKYKDKLVTWTLLLRAYLFTGMIESFAAFFMFFYYFHKYAGIPPSKLVLSFNSWKDGYFGYSIDQLNEFLYTGQTIFFVTLIITQFGNLLSTRTTYLSFFQHQPFRGETRNLYLFGAMLCSLLLAIFIVDVPIFQSVFSTRSPPIEFWLIPWGWAVLLFFLDEGRRFILRYFIRKGITLNYVWNILKNKIQEMKN